METIKLQGGPWDGRELRRRHAGAPTLELSILVELTDTFKSANDAITTDKLRDRLHAEPGHAGVPTRPPSQARVYEHHVYERVSPVATHEVGAPWVYEYVGERP